MGRASQTGSAAVNKAPKVILFEPEERDAASVHHIFQRHEYELRTVGALGEIGLDDGAAQAPAECVVMPLRLRDGASGVSACLQVKSVHALASVPIVGLSATSDKPIVQAFYEMGADCVFVPPFEADLVYYQIGALIRQRRLFRELVNELRQESAAADSPLSLLDACREALAVLTPQGRLTFLNRAALTLCGLKREEHEDWQGLSEVFSRILEEHSALLSHSIFPAQESQTVAAGLSFARADGQSFEGSVEIVPVRGQHNELSCYLLRIDDPGQWGRLATTLLQSQRARSLSLLSAAGILRLLDAGTIPGSATPISTIDKLLAEQPAQAPLEQTVTRLLEFLDLAISPSILVKVGIRRDLELAVRPGDLIQLLGHMLLYAAEFTGERGEITINSSDNIAGEGVSLIIGATALRHASYLKDIRITEFLAGDFSRFLDPEAPSNRLDYGLHAAQKIALKYRSQVEFRNPSDDLLKLRVRLPPIRRD